MNVQQQYHRNSWFSFPAASGIRVFFLPSGKEEIQKDPSNPEDPVNPV